MRNHFLRAGRVANLPSGGGGSSIVDTDLYVHYDFSDTNCWNRQSGTNTDDYTIHNLANDYNDGLLRSRTGASNSYRDASDSPCIDFNSSDGGGCIEFIPSNNSSDADDCSIVIPGSISSTNTSAWTYNITPVGSTDTNNLFKGIDNGAYTIEVWVRYYLDHSAYFLSDSKIVYAFSKNSSNTTAYHIPYVYGPNYSNASRRNKIRVVLGSFSATEQIPISGVPSSGAAWSDWMHFVYSRNSNTANDTKIYLNNSLEATSRENHSLDHMYMFSVEEVADSNRIPKRLGIFRFYRGKALTSSEVTTNWNAQKSRFGH